VKIFYQQSVKIQAIIEEQINTTTGYSRFILRREEEVNICGDKND
jgi:hypothetical protein